MKTLIFAIAISGLHVTNSHSIQEENKNERNPNKIEIITPNHPTLNTSEISDFNHKYVVYENDENNNRHLIGLYNYQMRKIQSKAQSDIRIKKEQLFINGKEQSDVALMADKTLKPKYVINKDDKAVTLISYTSEGVEGNVMMNSTTATFAYQTMAPAFDEQSTDLVVQSLPLNIGYQATFWTYSTENESNVEYQKLAVLGEVQTKAGNDQLTNAYIVEISNSTGTKTYTVAKNTRSILKVVQILANGKELVMERI
ncbi:hypothetical protein EP331_00990 [bacterium]|nr:MAG: hypothetical protein EP331_00990 [bacterium]